MIFFVFYLAVLLSVCWLLYSLVYCKMQSESMHSLHFENIVSMRYQCTSSTITRFIGLSPKCNVSFELMHSTFQAINASVFDQNEILGFANYSTTMWTASINSKSNFIMNYVYELISFWYHLLNENYGSNIKNVEFELKSNARNSDCSFGWRELIVFTVSWHSVWIYVKFNQIVGKFIPNLLQTQQTQKCYRHWTLNLYKFVK